jgi:hypothetical protein
MKRVWPVSLASAVLLALIPHIATAQSSAVVDEGTFTVSRNGAPVGRESFRVARTPAPGGQVFKASSTSALGDIRITSSLGTDSSGVPVAYESDVFQKGQLQQHAQGRGRPGRFSVLVQTRSGESAREYLLSDGALLLEDDVHHHFYFVALAARDAEVVVIAPRSAQQVRVKLENRGADSVEIAGRAIAARRFGLTYPDGTSRDVWVDESGRLLRVAVPAKGLVALRDDPPR